MTLPLPTLTAIAQAASDVPISAVGALAHHAQTFSPSTCLALLERVRELEERQQELLVTIRNLSASTPYPEESGNAATLIAAVGTLRSQAVEREERIRQLEAVLVEALDHWGGWDSGSGTSGDCDRIAELRKLAAGGTVRP